jgi:hypothetical protein
MVNRLIKAYLKKSDCREYNRMLLHKFLEKGQDMTKYLSAMKVKQGVQQSVPLLCAPNSKHGQESGSSGSDSRSESDISRKRTQRPSGEDIKFNKDKSETEVLSAADTALICEALLERITKTLVYMPLSMRYICKLAEKLASAYVLSLFSS